MIKKLLKKAIKCFKLFRNQSFKQIKYFKKPKGHVKISPNQYKKLIKITNYKIK